MSLCVRSGCCEERQGLHCAALLPSLHLTRWHSCSPCSVPQYSLQGLLHSDLTANNILLQTVGGPPLDLTGAFEVPASLHVCGTNVLTSGNGIGKHRNTWRLCQSTKVWGAADLQGLGLSCLHARMLCMLYVVAADPGVTRCRPLSWTSQLWGPPRSRRRRSLPR